MFFFGRYHISYISNKNAGINTKREEDNFNYALLVLFHLRIQSVFACLVGFFTLKIEPGSQFPIFTCLNIAKFPFLPPTTYFFLSCRCLSNLQFLALKFQFLVQTALFSFGSDVFSTTSSECFWRPRAFAPNGPEMFWRFGTEWEKKMAWDWTVWVDVRPNMGFFSATKRGAFFSATNVGISTNNTRWNIAESMKQSRYQPKVVDIQPQKVVIYNPSMITLW